MKTFCCGLFALLFFYGCKTTKKNSTETLEPFSYTLQKKIIATNGAVVSAHPLASKAGLLILQKGGNAIDAAIATQLALAVVYPNAGNLGGGGFLVAHLSTGQNIAIDYREMAPAIASREMYIDSTGNARTDKSQNGHLASGIPGTVAGLFASAKYGKLSFEELIQPAIELARNGFSISEREANALNSLQATLKKYNTVAPVFIKPAGWKAGDTLVQKDLAKTLERISEKGAAGFYEGETATLIIEEMKRGGGIITKDDLKNYVAKERSPHQFNYKGHTVIGMPMPSSGGALLHQMMKMTEPYGLDKMGFHSFRAVQLMIEAERRAYADRAEYMGDADYYKVPVGALTDSNYLISRMKNYNPAKAGNSEQVKPGQGLGIKESEETTHLSIIDKEGNAVAVTTTLNGSYGSGTVVGYAGFFLNNEMDDFSIKPGVPNMYGAVGGEANAIAPGKRMLSSMTPTIVLKHNKPFIVTGTPGGTTIPTSIFQTLVNIIDFDLSTEDAVYKPKFHHQWLPDRVDIEKGFPDSTIEALKKMGYTIQRRNAIGRTEVIKVLPDGRFEAIADNRGDDDARGW